MSSSPSRARIASPSENLPGPKPPEVLPFPYSEASPPLGHSSLDQPSSASRSPQEAPPTLVINPEREAHLRELGRQQGAAEARTKFEEQIVAERALIAQTISAFSRERAAYYRKIEEETVQLSLAIARKVIHREAQVDPFLLMGIARVAVERMEGATEVVLLVHPSQAPAWRKYLAPALDSKTLSEIVEDPALPPQQCRLRTSLGMADLGLEVQLKEIEKGLLDLLAARPDSSSRKDNGGSEP